jgi:hypothetical protein
MIIEKIKKKDSLDVWLWRNDLISIFYSKNKKKITLEAHNKWFHKSFLKNLYNNLINHNIVLCAELGSTMFYSLFLEKKTSLILKVKENSFYKEIETPKRGFDKEKYIKFMDRHNFLKNKGFIDKKLGKRLANKVLGLNNLKSKNELKAYLGWNNKIKIFLAKLFAKIIDLKYPNKR